MDVRSVAVVIGGVVVRHNIGVPMSNKKFNKINIALLIPRICLCLLLFVMSNVEFKDQRKHVLFYRYLVMVHGT